MSPITAPLNSPAGQIADLLVRKGLGMFPAANVSWPIYISSLPDDPADAISVYDTTGTEEGRLMATGQRIEHPGIQIRVRAANYQDGWNRSRAIALFCDRLYRESVIPNDFGSLLSSIRRNQVNDIGPEPGKPRRLFTLNLLLTYAAS